MPTLETPPELAGDPFINMESSGCFFCGLPSTLLCDGHLAWLSDDGISTSRKAKEFTCDRRLCRACAKQEGLIHFNMGKNSHWDSRDYCRDCIKEGRQIGESKPHYSKNRPNPDLVTEAQGLALQARRKFFAVKV